MIRRTSRTDRAAVARLAHVLAGLAYPAEKWQIVAHAEHYGADAVSTAQLWTLPIGRYPDLAHVCHALGLVPDPWRPDHRPPPSVRASARDLS